MTPHRGFTLIELLLVLSVILILTVMGLGHYGEALRKAAVQESADLIIEANELARQLALLGKDDSRGYPGVRLSEGSDGICMVELVRQDRSGRIDAEEGPGGEPRLSRKLPSSVNIWVGDGSLAAGPGVIAWYYAPGHGEVAEVSGGQVASTYTGVGVPIRSVDALWGLDTNTLISPVIAPATPTAPGLSVRSTDNRFKIAVGVYPSGLGYASAFESYPEGAP